MADVRNDGNLFVGWVDAVPADLDAPTASELTTSAIELHAVMTPDGLVGFEAGTGEVDNSKLSSTFNTKDAGRKSFSGTMIRAFKQSGTDDAFDTMTYGTSGAIFVRRGTSVETAIAASDEVEVYPVTCGEVRLLPPESSAEGSYQKYEVPVMINAEPSLRAVVAA